MLADTRKAQDCQVNRGVSRDELKAFQKRYAKDMETLFYLVASLTGEEIPKPPETTAP